MIMNDESESEVEKQTGGETTTIQVVDTDSQSIEDMVDQSLLQTEESIPKSNRYNKRRSVLGWIRS